MGALKSTLSLLAFCEVPNTDATHISVGFPFHPPLPPETSLIWSYTASGGLISRLILTPTTPHDVVRAAARLPQADIFLPIPFGLTESQAVEVYGSLATIFLW